MKELSEEKTSIQEGPKIWSTILEEVQQIDSKKLPTNKSILVLGDNETGKTTLVAKLNGTDATKKGSGLEYNFIEVRDEYRDDSAKLGAWILDGDLRHMDLLNFALTEANFEHSCCLLVASMSQPWNILSSLENWASVLEKHIESLKISPTKMEQCRQKLLLKFLNYDNISDETITSVNELGENTLTKNLGIEIVVVISKTDYISNLEKDFDYTEETFDFIQQAIRKFCLQYGASLFYVSSKINKNCDLLHKYLAHRIYDLPFKGRASVVDRDAIFVPAGWDNQKKISILYDNIRSANPDDDYKEVIAEPTSNGPTQRDAEVEAESDQEFLLRMQNDLGKQVQGPVPNAPSPVQPRQNLNNSIDNQPSGEGALQNFFNSLLSRGRTIPPGAGPQE